MEAIDFLWLSLGIIWIIGNLVGIALFHETEGDDYNLHKNKFTFWFLTAMFAIVGVLYTLFKTANWVLNKFKH